jgi:hypothetical protein
VLVVVIAVYRVAVAVVQVVHVVTVGHRHMATPVAVGVAMCLMGLVPTDLALVVVTLVRTVEMSIVEIVGVVLMRNGHVPATLPVHMVVRGVFGVRRGHCSAPSLDGRTER